MEIVIEVISLLMLVMAGGIGGYLIAHKLYVKKLIEYEVESIKRSAELEGLKEKHNAHTAKLDEIEKSLMLCMN